MTELHALRFQGIRLLATVAWLATLAIAAGSFFAGTGISPLVMAIAISIFPTFAAIRGLGDRATLMAFGATMPLYSALLVYQWSGHELQIDLHMSFFAMIAMLAVLADWRPVLVGAAITAVHHLVLNFAAPALVFPNGTDLGRVVLHAVIVLAETAVLVVLAMRLESFLLAQARATAEKIELERAAERERERQASERQLVVEQIAGGLQGLARGDLTSVIETRFPPAFETLRVDFNKSIGRLKELAGKVSESSLQIQHGTSEIQIAADDLAQRTVLQADSVERTFTTLSALSASAADTARHSSEADQALANSRQQAERGQVVMAQAIEAMHAIEQSSSQIASFLTLIDGIAFQTNLLALNAGVEAARAGDAGKGFAVVANEVRALAQRSADAAREIAKVIQTSETQVSAGVASVTETGQVLSLLVGDVRSVSDLVRDIAHKAGANANELANMQETFSAIDRATQQNAAMVEESNAALRTLANEARGLIDAVEQFSGVSRNPPLARAA